MGQTVGRKISAGCDDLGPDGLKRRQVEGAKEKGAGASRALGEECNGMLPATNSGQGNVAALSLLCPQDLTLTVS